MTLDAQTVWHAWRRIMRDDSVQEAMFSGSLAERAAELELSPAELEVAECYAASPAGTRFFIAGFRYRMASSFLNALETAAPLTHRLMRANGIEIEALGTEFLESVGWRDFGPYVHTYGAEVLGFLCAHPVVGALRGLTDLAALELAAVRLTIAAAERAPDFTPVPGRYRASDAVSFVTTELDVSPLLRGEREVAAGSRTFLVFLTPPDLRRRIVAVPDSAAELVRSLKEPRPVAEAGGQALLAKLVRLGVVIGAG